LNAKAKYEITNIEKTITSPVLINGFTFHNWRASEASKTLSGVNNGNRIYIYSTYNLNFVARAQNDV